MSLLRGPMTRNEIKQTLEMRKLLTPSRSRVPVKPTEPTEPTAQASPAN
jgi:hypothetical protein